MDISAYQSNIYTVPLTAATLSAIINGAGVTALEISGPITVSDANPLLVNNPNLVVSGAGSIHQADGVGTTVETHWYWNEYPDPMTYANEVRFWGIKSWTGVNFTGQWWRCDWQVDDVTVSNCRMPRDIWFPWSYTTSVERCRFENLSGTKRIVGMMDDCYIGHNADLNLVSVVGSNNTIEYNSSGAIFTGVPTQTQTGNIVRYNTSLDCPHEYICYDCDRGRNNIASGVFGSAALAPDNAQIGRLSCDLSTGGFDYPVGSRKGPIAILPNGVYYFVLRNGSGYVDVDLTGRYGASTFLSMQQGAINIQRGFALNKIYGNSWTLNYDHYSAQDPAGISLFGGCVDNEVYGNTGPDSYDFSVIVDARQFDPQGELAAWELPLAVINSNNYWHDNNHVGSKFNIGTVLYDGSDVAASWDAVGNNPAMIQEKTTVINDINIGTLYIWDALDTKWVNPGTSPLFINQNLSIPAGTPHGTYVTFTNDSVPPMVASPATIQFTQQPFASAFTSNGFTVNYGTADILTAILGVAAQTQSSQLQTLVARTLMNCVSSSAQTAQLVTASGKISQLGNVQQLGASQLESIIAKVSLTGNVQSVQLSQTESVFYGALIGALSSVQCPQIEAAIAELSQCGVVTSVQRVQLETIRNLLAMLGLVTNPRIKNITPIRSFRDLSN